MSLVLLLPALVPSSPSGWFPMFISKHWVTGKVNSISMQEQTCGHTAKPGGSLAVSVPRWQQVLCARAPLPNV